MVRKVLLFCGILAPLLRVATDVLAAMWYPGYSYIDQTMSQLAAIGAPTRAVCIPFGCLRSFYPRRPAHTRICSLLGIDHSAPGAGCQRPDVPPVAHGL